jgi:prefoldin subunit 5
MKKTYTEKQIVQMIKKEEAILKGRRQYLKRIERVLKDTFLSIESLKELNKNNGKVFVKLGSGIAIEAEIKTETCKRAFAENGFIDEKIPNTIKWLEKRKTNIKIQMKKNAKDVNKSKTKLNQLVTIVKQIEAEKRKNISVK